MKIPFYKLYGWFFSSFKVDSDTEFLNKNHEKYGRVMVIKRSWLFGLFASWLLLAIWVLAIVNIFNTIHSVWLSPFWVSLVILFIISFWLLLRSSISYLYKYKKTYNEWNIIRELEEVRKDLEYGDELFINFFNQITQNIFLFAIIILLEIWYVVYNFLYNPSFEVSILSSILDIFLLGLQIYVMWLYKKKMIDIEMDYSIVVPGTIYFINQTWMYSQNQNLNTDKIKTVNSRTWNFFQSFFNLWSITILTEWDQVNWQMEIYYIEDPKKTVEQMKSLLEYKTPTLTNSYLKEILEQLKIPSDQYLKEKYIWTLRSYLKEHDSLIKEDYEKWNLIVKTEIKEIYNTVMK